METSTFKLLNDVELKADVYAPAKNHGKLRRTVLWLHGGALQRGGRLGIHGPMKERFLDAGYVLVLADCRLAPKTRLPGIISDVKDAYAWLRREGPARFSADPARIAVFGSSAGSYLTLMLGCRSTPPPPALLSMWGFCDIEVRWRTKPPDWPWLKMLTGHDPSPPSEAYGPFCPARNVSKEHPPTFLLHGAEDEDVPCEQSILMKEVLDHHRVPSQLVIVPGANHGLHRGGDAKAIDDAFDAAFRFVDERL